MLFCSIQLRVVRAFKSTLEDIEEKRSIHSFHSFHSIRSSRSHQGHRPLSEVEVLHSNHHYRIKKSPSTGQNGSYTNMAMIIQEHSNFKVNGKSRSAENVALVDAGYLPPMVVIQGASNNPSPRTLSSSDLSTHKLYETTI